MPHAVPPEPGDDPIAVFQAWLAEAEATEPDVPDAASLATVDGRGQPAIRMVLLKSIAPDGVDFFTNLESAKAGAIAANPQVAICVHWKSLGRQVRIAGRAELLPDADADRYWATRGRGSQISAWCSKQSEPVSSREALEAQRATMAERFAGEDTIARPPFWGGYRVVPERIELWITREDRLHDRLRYVRDGKRWTRVRLQP